MFDDRFGGAASCETADAAAPQSGGRLRTMRLNLGYPAVRAPLAGRVSRIGVTLRKLVNDQRVLTTLPLTPDGMPEQAEFAPGGSAFRP